MTARPSLRTDRGIGYVAIMKQLALVMVTVMSGCGKESGGKAEQPAEQTVVRSPPTVTAIAVDAGIDALLDALRDRLNLPVKTVDSKLVIWRSVADVAKVLGPGVERADGRWRYEIGDGDFVLIVYERGRAVGIEVPMASASGPYSDEEFKIIGDWFHAPEHNGTILGHKVLMGDSFTRSSIALYDANYITALEKRVEVETQKRMAEEARTETKRLAEEERQRVETDRDRSASLLRGRVHLQRLSAEMARSGIDAKFEVGDTETDVWYTGICNQSVLDDLAARMKQSFSSFGFERMRCQSYVASLR